MTWRWLSIVGIGEDGYLPPVAREALTQSGVVWGGRRHLHLAADALRAEAVAWPSPMDSAFPDILARRGQPTAVLASGDPFCFGVGSVLATLVPMAEIACHPAPSAFTLARARLGWADAVELSVCGRPMAALAPHLHDGARLLVLSADGTTPAALAAFLTERGFGKSRLTVLQAMGGSSERVAHAVAASFDVEWVSVLNTVAIEVVGRAAHHLACGLPDALFEHDGQITRREIRALTLSSLQPRPGGLLWDVGGGAGSVAIEWMLRHPASRAVAIERDPERAARIGGNALALGVPALRVVCGTAPDALGDLPPPDAVFVGGGAHVPGVIEAGWRALPAGGRMVANAVTLETEGALVAAQARYGGELLRVALSRLDGVGSMHAFRPAMTVTQWAASKQ